MQSELEFAYSPKRSTMAAVMIAFGVGAAFLAYFALTEPWTPATTGILRMASAAAVLSLVVFAAFGAILLRSRNWRVRLDSRGVSIDTLVGRRSIEWRDLKSVEMVGKGATRSVLVTGAKGSLAINAMLMSNPSQLEDVFRLLKTPRPADAMRQPLVFPTP